MVIGALKQPHYSMLIDMNNAKLLYKRTPTQQIMKTQKNGLHIENSPARLEIDNRAFFNSIGLKDIGTLSREEALEGNIAIRDAVKEISEEGDMMMGPDGMTIAQIAKMKTQGSKMMRVAVEPIEKPKIHFTKGKLDIQYEPDKLDIRWEIGGINFRYLPYELSIEFVPLNG